MQTATIFSAWGAIGLVAVGGTLVFLGMLFGAWAVFRTRHAGSGFSFLETPTRKKKVGSYLPDGFFDDGLLEDIKLSPEAERLKAQDDNPASFLASRGKTREQVLEMVKKGKRKSSGGA